MEVAEGGGQCVQVHTSRLPRLRPIQHQQQNAAERFGNHRRLTFEEVPGYSCHSSARNEQLCVQDTCKSHSGQRISMDDILTIYRVPRAWRDRSAAADLCSRYPRWPGQRCSEPSTRGTAWALGSGSCASISLPPAVPHLVYRSGQVIL